MDAAEYKHVVLGLIFLKYISDSFEELYTKLKADKHSDEEDKDEYLAENVFFVPPTARWIWLYYLFIFLRNVSPPSIDEGANKNIAAICE
jgi:type I restriction enzyme M protein